MNVEKAVKRFMRDYRGELTFTDLKNYVEKQLNFKLLFFDTELAIKEMSRVGIKIPRTEKGLALNSGATKIVFIKSNMSEDEKIQCLLHEIGHIILGDLNVPSRELNRPKAEQDAELFSYLVISAMKRRETRPQRIAVCVAAVSVAVAVITVVLALTL